MNAYLIFDIGKTNKKALLYSEAGEVLSEESIQFDEIEDEDGYPSDDLTGIRKWMLGKYSDCLRDTNMLLQGINVSAYGASLVHLGNDGHVCSSFYNYLKPVDEEIWTGFLEGEDGLLEKTASPPLRMLNSGFQLYWLWRSRPDVFAKTMYSLHLPQYLAYLFTGNPVNEFTSLGCHTCLWNFSTMGFASWVSQIQLDRKFPALATTLFQTIQVKEKTLRIGNGMHDSSAALFPYIRMMQDRFVLISTGTWSISLNPYDQEPLTKEEINSDCLNFLQPNGHKVKGSRIFLGKEYEVQVARMAAHFGIMTEDINRIAVSGEEIRAFIQSNPRPRFQPTTFGNSGPKVSWQGLPNPLDSYMEPKAAYLQLNWDLAQWQKESTSLVVKNGGIKKLVLTGGFSKNTLFLCFLGHIFPNLELVLSNQPRASALGALMAVHPDLSQQHFLDLRPFEIP